MRVSLVATSVAVFTWLCEAAPSQIKPRDVSQGQLDDLSFWVQYAAAAYCQQNYQAAGGAFVACPAGNCPAVEQDHPTVLLSFSNSTIHDTSGFVAVDHALKTIVLVFRGSYSVRNWVSDAEFLWAPTGLCTGCFAEYGFWLSWLSVKPLVVGALKVAIAEHPTYKLVVTGHSLGAAVTTLATADLRHAGFNATFYAYASPRVANAALATYINKFEGNYRVHHRNDPVCEVPPHALGYVHTSPEYYISSENNITVQTTDIVVKPVGESGDNLKVLARLDIQAHNWYFEQANACINPGLPFSERVSTKWSRELHRVYISIDMKNKSNVS